MKMISNCFAANYIRLKGDCNTYTTQSSGLYINDLPGLSFRLLSNLSNEEQINASALYQISHTEGLKRMITDFKMGIGPDFQLNNVLSSGWQGRLSETFGAAGTKTVGKELELVNCNDRFQCLYLEYVEIRVDTPQSFTISIVDGYTTTNYTQTLTAGRNRIQLEYEANETTVQLVYDSTGISMPDDLHCWNTGSNCVCNGACSSSTGYSGVTIKDVELSGGSYIDSNDENGLRVASSVRCSSDELVCIFFQELARAARYAIAIDILERVMSTDRINGLVRTKKEQADELLIRWEGGRHPVSGFTHKGSYHKEIESVINQARRFIANEKGKTKCISCTGNRVQFIHP